MSPHTKSDPSTHSWVAMTTFRKGMVLDQHPTVGVGFKPASLTTDLVLLPQASLCKIAVITEEASLCLHDLTCRSLTFSSTWPQHTHTLSLSSVHSGLSSSWYNLANHQTGSTYNLSYTHLQPNHSHTQARRWTWTQEQTCGVKEFTTESLNHFKSFLIC